MAYGKTYTGRIVRFNLIWRAAEVQKHYLASCVAGSRLWWSTVHLNCLPENTQYISKEGCKFFYFLYCDLEAKLPSPYTVDSYLDRIVQACNSQDGRHGENFRQRPNSQRAYT